MIVVIDEDTLSLRSMTEALERDGYAVAPFNEPYRALAFITREVPDLVLCEVRMAEMSGYELFRTYNARFERRKTPFIFISNLASPDLIARGLDKGVDDFLSKPVPTNLLQAKVRSHLRRASRIGLRVMRGTLNQLPFTALLRHCEQAGLNGLLEVSAENVQVSIPYKSGELDEEAIAQSTLDTLLALQEGHFAIVSVPTTPCTIALAAVIEEAGENEIHVDDDLFRASVEESAQDHGQTQTLQKDFSDAPSTGVVISSRSDDINAPEALPSGRLSGVRLGGRLFQVQTEVIEGAQRRIMTFATHGGKALITRATVCSEDQTRQEMGEQVHLQHKAVEEEIRNRVEGFLTGPTQTPEVESKPTQDELFEKGAERKRAGDLQGALDLWEAAARLEPDNKFLTRQIELLGAQVAPSAISGGVPAGDSAPVSRSHTRRVRKTASP